MSDRDSLARMTEDVLSEVVEGMDGLPSEERIDQLRDEIERRLKEGTAGKPRRVGQIKATGVNGELKRELDKIKAEKAQEKVRLDALAKKRKHSQTIGS